MKAKQSREVMWDGKEDESLVKKVMEMANCNFFQVLSDGPNTTTSTTASSARLAPSSSPSSASDTSSLSSSPALTSSPALSNNSPMSDSPATAGPRFTDSPLRHSGQFSAASPMLSSPSVGRSASNKDTDDSNLSSSSGSGSEGQDEEFTKMKMSGEITKNAWNDDKHNVNMSETTDPIGASSWRSINGNKEPSSLSESICANCHSPFMSHINKVVWLEISEHMARLKLTSTLRTALECKTRYLFFFLI